MYNKSHYVNIAHDSQPSLILEQAPMFITTMNTFVVHD